MSDLAKTDPQWEDFVEAKLGTWLALRRTLLEERERCIKERDQVVLLFADDGTYIDAQSLTLSGINLGVNTSDDGILYMRITGSGPYTCTLYTASGASGAVAAGSASAGATATLTAQNSSGLTGSVDIPAPPNTSVDDSLTLFCLPDWRLRALRLWDGEDSKDTEARQLFEDTLDTIADKITSAIADVDTALERWAIDVANQGRAFTGIAASSLATESTDVDAGGAVSQKRSGFASVLRQAMADETTGSTQDVAETVPAGGAGSADGNNDGQGTIASHTPQENCPPMTVTLTCIRGHNSSDGMPEQFRVVGKLTNEDEDITLGTLTVGQSFSGKRGFGPITLVRAPSKTNDGSNNIFTAASNATESGATLNNTDYGALYVSTEANASNWDILFYKNSRRDSGDLVAKATNIASGASFSATQQNASGLSIGWQLGGTESAVTNITLDLNAFSTENSSGAADSFTVAVTHTSTGKFQKAFTDAVKGGWLNSTTAGSEQLNEGGVTRGAFVPRAVYDV